MSTHYVVYYCRRCLGTNVQLVDWILPNHTHEIDGATWCRVSDDGDAPSAPDRGWCGDCAADYGIGAVVLSAPRNYPLMGLPGDVLVNTDQRRLAFDLGISGVSILTWCAEDLKNAWRQGKQCRQDLHGR